MEWTMTSDDRQQIPTPPLSVQGSPQVEQDNANLVSVSTTFYPGAELLNNAQPDTILLSNDNVFFYVHRQLLLTSSENEFNQKLSNAAKLQQKPEDHQIVNVQDDSNSLNIILHSIYNVSCAHYSPSFQQLSIAIRRFPAYGLRVNAYIGQSTPLYTLLLSHAPLCPMDLYALAASFDLYDLAVATSSHLLSFPLSSISDELVLQMGPIYLKRLFFLHFGRTDALKRVLLPPPHPHAPTPTCDFTDQKKLTRAWALASAYLAWDARPGMPSLSIPTNEKLSHILSHTDLSTSTMESALRPLADHLSCSECKAGLNDRIKNLVVQWSIVKVSNFARSRAH
jgi:hypothetical protein